MKPKLLPEPILLENRDRFVIFPIKHKEIWEMYKQLEHNFWLVSNAYFDQDIDDYQNKLNDEEKEFVQFAITNFLLRANNDRYGILNRFMEEMQYPEARCFIGFQLMLTNLHTKTFGYISDSLQKPEQFDTMKKIILDSESMIKQSLLERSRLYSDRNFHSRLFTYATIQRMWQSSLFPAIASFKKREIMKGFTTIVALIYEDEGMFTDFSLSICNQLANKLSFEEAKEILKRDVLLEQESIRDFLPYYQSIGLKQDQLDKHVQYIADSIAIPLYGKTIFDTRTIPYMEAIWKRTMRKIDPNKNWEEESKKNEFSLDADF